MATPLGWAGPQAGPQALLEAPEGLEPAPVLPAPLLAGWLLQAGCRSPQAPGVLSVPACITPAISSHPIRKPEEQDLRQSLKDEAAMDGPVMRKIWPRPRRFSASPCTNIIGTATRLCVHLYCLQQLSPQLVG